MEIFKSCYKAKSVVVFVNTTDAYCYNFAYSMIAIRVSKRQARDAFERAQGRDRKTLWKFNSKLRSNKGFEKVSVYVQPGPVVHHHGGIYFLSSGGPLTADQMQFVCNLFGEWIIESPEQRFPTTFDDRDPDDCNPKAVRTFR